MNDSTGLRARRNALGLTQRALAEQANCSISLIAFIEAGWRTRGPGVQSIAQVLGCTVDEILARDAEDGAEWA